MGHRCSDLGTSDAGGSEATPRSRSYEWIDAGLFGAARDRQSSSRCTHTEHDRSQFCLVSILLLMANLIGWRGGWNPGSHAVR